jgi:hypothetical protein
VIIHVQQTGRDRMFENGIHTNYHLTAANNNKKKYRNNQWLGLWCLTPISTISVISLQSVLLVEETVKS